MSASLVGSEMCIRDSNLPDRLNFLTDAAKPAVGTLASHLQGWASALSMVQQNDDESGGLAAAGTG
eukprot:6256118-Alexandrium_andersonii.AAC.1